MPITEKRRNRPNIWPEIPSDLSLWRRPSCQSLSKALDISSATARVAPDLLKALAILSETAVRRSAVDWEDLKPYWKWEKRSDFSRWSKILLFTKLLKDFAYHIKKTNRTIVFSSRPFPIILKCRDHRWDFQTIWKTILF